MNWT